MSISKAKAISQYQTYLRTYFWSKLIKQLLDSTLIVSIEEYNIGGSCRINYSLRQKEENDWFKTNIVVSISLVLGTCSNEWWWFWFLADSTINPK